MKKLFLSICLVACSLALTTQGIAQTTTNNVYWVGPNSQYATIEAAIAAWYNTFTTKTGPNPSGGLTISLAPGFTETTTNLVVGCNVTPGTNPSSCPSADLTPITIIGYPPVTLTMTGTTGVQLFNGSSMICAGSVSTMSTFNNGTTKMPTNSCTLTSAQTSSPLSLLSNGDQDGQEFFYAEKWYINCGDASNVSFSNGCVDVNTVYVPSALRDIVIMHFANSVGLHIHTNANNASGNGTNVFECDNCWINSSGTSPGTINAGAQPVLIDRPAGGDSVTAIHFFGGAIENPGVTLPALKINGNGANYQMSVISFDGTQVQQNPNNTVSPVSITDAQGVSIRDMMFNGMGSTTYPCVDLEQTANYGLAAISLENIHCGSSAPSGTSVVQNEQTGYASPKGQWLLTRYYYAGSSTVTGFGASSAFATPFIFDGAGVFTQQPTF